MSIPGERDTLLFKYHDMEETYKILEVSLHNKSQGAPKTYRTHQSLPHGYRSRNNIDEKETQDLFCK